MNAEPSESESPTFTEASGQVRARFREWQKKIARRKFADVDDAMVERRLDLLREPAVTGPRLASYLRAQLELSADTSINAPPLLQTSASDMNEYPFEWEVRVHEALSEVTPSQASDPVTWCLWHIAWLEEGRFTDAPRATFNAERVSPVPDSASEMSTEQKKALDEDIRNLLRRLGSFLEGRGNRPAQDAPIARAWWRRHLAVVAASGTADAAVPMTPDDCHKVLRAGDWGRFTDRGRASYANLLHARAMGAVCCASRAAPDVRLWEIMTTVARRCEHHHPQLLDFTRLAAPPPTTLLSAPSA